MKNPSWWASGILIAFAASSTSTEREHPVTQSYQSFNSPIVAGNNNNAAVSWNGWPYQQTVQADAYFRFLQPPYSGNAQLALTTGTNNL